MDYVARVAHLVELVGKERRTVEARVEGAHLVEVAAADLYTAQHLVPCLAALLGHLLERVVAQLLEVRKRLLGAYERRGYAGVNLLALAGCETYDCAGMVCLLRERTLVDLAVGNGGDIFEGLVELDDKVILEVAGNAAAVARSVSRDSVVGLVDLDGRSAVEGVNHHIRILRVGECESEDGGTVCWGELRDDVMLGEVDLVIVCLGHFALVREPACALVLIEYGCAYDGHYRELSEVVDPRAGLMRLLESADLVVGIDILPAVSHLARLRGPEVHTPRAGDGGVGVSRRELECRERPDQRIDVVDG